MFSPFLILKKHFLSMFCANHLRFHTPQLPRLFCRGSIVISFLFAGFRWPELCGAACNDEYYYECNDHQPGSAFDDERGFTFLLTRTLHDQCVWLLGVWQHSLLRLLHRLRLYRRLIACRSRLSGKDSMNCWLCYVAKYP